jgi:hypothetical protein
MWKVGFLRRCVFVQAGVVLFGIIAGYSQAPAAPIDLQDDHPVYLRFFGSSTADLFTRELDESFQGVLSKSFVATTGHGFPAGFVNASLPGFPWAGTMWTRDAGAFMRELVMRGYYEHASLMAECLMSLVEKDRDGYYAFPRFFKGSQPGSGSELDGTASIVIGMELLWERLADGNPTKNHIRDFLIQQASPLNSLTFRLRTEPLLSGSGEFGCGWTVSGECDNVVQNNLSRLALLATARMAEEAGRGALAADYRKVAAQISDGMEKYLVDRDGSWIWCIDHKSLLPNPEVLNAAPNRGTGILNGVVAMDADVLGFLPSTPQWEGIGHSQKTFLRLYNTPLRKTEFDRYGIWTQFDGVAAGLLSSPSYGEGYAIQAMLLFDDLAMTDKGLSWLASATVRPIPEYQLHRASPYYFYERMYPPDAVGKVKLEEGCGALNLVNVAEPLKVSRLILGVDDSAPDFVQVLPRIPPSWKGVEARNWPIRTRTGIVRADILYHRSGSGATFTLKIAQGEQIDDLKVRMPSKSGFLWREEKNARSVRVVTH